MKQIKATDFTNYTLVFTEDGCIKNFPSNRWNSNSLMPLHRGGYRYVLAKAIQCKKNNNYFEVSQSEAEEIVGIETVNRYKKILRGIEVGMMLTVVKVRIEREKEAEREELEYKRLHWKTVEAYHLRKSGYINHHLSLNNSKISSYIDEKENWFYDDHFKVIESQYDGDDWNY